MAYNITTMFSTKSYHISSYHKVAANVGSFGKGTPFFVLVQHCNITQIAEFIAEKCLVCCFSDVCVNQEMLP